MAEIIPEPNTFIGGVGVTINTASLLAAKFTIDESDIQAFNVDSNNNISCFIGVNYDFLLGSFDGNSALTYYIDTQSKAQSVNQTSFRSTINCKALLLNGVNNSNNVSSGFRNCRPLYINFPELVSLGAFYLQGNNNAKYIYLPKLTTATTSVQSMRGSGSCNRLYIPLCTVFNTDTDFNATFANLKIGCKLYVKPSTLTSNAGNPEIALQFAVDEYSAVLIGVTDFTKPNAVNNLSASSIATTTAVLDFTAPTSFNTLDFYEVWIERLDLDEWNVDRVAQRYSVHQEVTASGQTLSGLLTATSYKVRIVACDEYYNRSEFSNEIEFTTT